MKTKLILYFFLLFSIVFLIYGIINYSKKKTKKIIPTKTLISTPTNLSTINNQNTQNQKIYINLFISYWNIPKNYSDLFLPKINFSQKLSSIIYFGVKPSLNGIDENDLGYKKISEFNANFAEAPVKKLLTLRMIESSSQPDSKLINKILENNQKQNMIIENIIINAKQYGFDGILLDLELSPPATQKIINQTNVLVETFSKKIKENNLSFGIIISADSLYRNRPYDLKIIKQNADKVYLMAYDFHKPFGTPGPNFPLFGKEKYGYDLSTALDQMIPIIGAKKINIIFGLYGYDWLVDIKKRPIKNAKAMNLSNIKKNFIDKCFWKNCVISQDQSAGETEINYVDKNGELHIVWFDDEKSINKKIKHSQLQVISEFSYWVWGYY